MSADPQDPGRDLGSFAIWASGDLLDNRVRGIYAEWLVGQALGCIEPGSNRQEWDAVDFRYRGHGKLFTSLVRTHLGIETERRSKTVLENERLRRLLRKHGIDPDEEV